MFVSFLILLDPYVSACPEADALTELASRTKKKTSKFMRKLAKTFKRATEDCQMFSPRQTAGGGVMVFRRQTTNGEQATSCEASSSQKKQHSSSIPVIVEEDEGDDTFSDNNACEAPLISLRENSDKQTQQTKITERSAHYMGHMNDTHTRHHYNSADVHI